MKASCQCDRGDEKSIENDGTDCEKDEVRCYGDGEGFGEVVATCCHNNHCCDVVVGVVVRELHLWWKEICT